MATPWQEKQRARLPAKKAKRQRRLARQYVTHVFANRHAEALALEPEIRRGRMWQRLGVADPIAMLRHGAAMLAYHASDAEPAIKLAHLKQADGDYESAAMFRRLEKIGRERDERGRHFVWLPTPRDPGLN